MFILSIPTEYLRISFILICLFVFGVLYNALVTHLERTHQEEGVISVLVVGGTVATLIGVFFIHSDAALISLVAFVASGLPMLVGSLYRHFVARRQLHEAYRASQTKNS